MTERFLQSDGHLHGVVVACQRADGRWLMIRRSDRVPAPLKVCFPGGALDEGEDQETTLVREMQEELGAVVEPVRCVWHYRWPDRPLTLWGWLAELKSTTLIPSPDEVHEILWLSEAEALRHPDVLPNTDAFLAALRQAVGNSENRREANSELSGGKLGTEGMVCGNENVTLKTGSVQIVTC